MSSTGYLEHAKTWEHWPFIETPRGDYTFLQHLTNYGIYNTKFREKEINEINYY